MLASDPYLWLLAVLHGHLLATPGVFAEVDGAEGPFAELMDSLGAKDVRKIPEKYTRILEKTHST